MLLSPFALLSFHRDHLVEAVDRLLGVLRVLEPCDVTCNAVGDRGMRPSMQIASMRSQDLTLCVVVAVLNVHRLFVVVVVVRVLKAVCGGIMKWSIANSGMEPPHSPPCRRRSFRSFRLNPTILIHAQRNASPGRPFLPVEGPLEAHAALVCVRQPRSFLPCAAVHDLKGTKGSFSA